MDLQALLPELTGIARRAGDAILAVYGRDFDVVTKDEAISACSNEEGFERIISGIKSSEGRKLLK